MTSNGGLTAALILVVAALVATPSVNAASTRAEYVSQAEGICSAPSGQLASIINQLNKVGKAKGLRPPEVARRLGKIVGRFATLEANILNQLATWTAAPGDEATVAQWLQGERSANAVVARAARAGKHGNLRRYLSLLTRSISVAGQANQIVAGWGFQPASGLISPRASAGSRCRPGRRSEARARSHRSRCGSCASPRARSGSRCPPAPRAPRGRR